MKRTKNLAVQSEDDESDQAYRELARSQYQDDGSIEIDDDAVVSKSGADGAYVQAWVWVADSDECAV